MLIKLNSCALIGLEGVGIEVEVDVSKGQPKIHIVGLPDTAIQESRQRIRSAIRNSDLEFPYTKNTVTGSSIC
jgi:magnesium chelatase family protein